MMLTVNCQLVKKVRQPVKMDNFYHQPSIQPGIISRQTSYISSVKGYYSPKQ